MTLKAEWINHCLELSREPAEFYSGCRKIIRGRILRFSGLDDSLQMADAGYTKSKMSHLRRNYLHEESKAVAIELWAKRKGQAKYGSVGFTCYAHFVKGGSIDAKRSKRASVFGPCIQSVTITWLSKTTVAIDAFYRSTELLKKFPADLVFLRDELLAGFDFEGMKIVEVNCHFANITIHPMYFVTLIPMIPDPVEELEDISGFDNYFHNWLVKWTARYVCEEHSRGIQKFAQALRVAMDAKARIKPRKLASLQKYLRDNHPGHRNGYVDPTTDIEDEEE
ncbi:hypothetical protein POLEWNIK_00770 [Brevundimonas phage vB_BpoS-Polewnik]|nr:hypothetical protein POLEWNIK_00770 [Brevundimonas phage vB_BpoS-Polewnik]